MGNLLLGIFIGAFLSTAVMLSTFGESLNSPWWAGSAGVVVGTVLAAMFTFIRDALQTKAKANAVATTIYTELVDRVARCCFDYDRPFSQYAFPNPDQTTNRSRMDVTKFRPTDPVAYPSIGANLALLPTRARSHVVQFYSSLDRWRREIDDISQSKKDLYAGTDLVRLQRRLGETLPYAERAIWSLSNAVKDAEAIDKGAFDGIYLTAVDERKRRLTESNLRETLSELCEHAVRSRGLESKR